MPAEAALQYNADVERYRFLSRWKHTVLPMVVKDPIFWLLMGWHGFIVLAQQAAHSQDAELPPLNWKAAATLASLLSFFVVFYGARPAANRASLPITARAIEVRP